MLNPSTNLPTFYAIDLHIFFQFVLIKLGIIVFGHAHLHSRTDSRALRAECCIVSIPHNTTILFVVACWLR